MQKYLKLVLNRTLIFLETHYYEFHTTWIAIKQYYTVWKKALLYHENICFVIAKFVGNEYSVKSLQRYAKAQEFHETINSWVLKIGQWSIQHWFDKIIFMTHGNDLLQMCLLVCTASNYCHMWMFINFSSYMSCV